MPSTVKALDVLLSPLTTITTRLPFAAGRDVPSGSTEVPFLTTSPQPALFCPAKYT